MPGMFHAEMSFLGCFGSLYDDTGLKEVLEKVFAPNSVPQILAGKATGRGFGDIFFHQAC